MPLTIPPATSSVFNPLNGYLLYEDFSTASYSGGTGMIMADYSWATQQEGSVGITFAGTHVPSDSTHPGVLEIGGTAANTGCVVYSALFNGAINKSIILGNGVISFDAVLYINALSTGSDIFNFCVGLGDTPWNALGTAVQVRYQSSTSLNWHMYTASAASVTTTTSSIPVTTGWHHVRIIVDETAANISFYIDGVLGGTSTTNIPTVAMPIVLAAWKSTSSNVAYYGGFDFIQIQKTFTTGRGP